MEIIANSYLLISYLLIYFNFRNLNLKDKINIILFCLMPFVHLQNKKITLCLHLIYTYLVLTVNLATDNKIMLMISLFGSLLWFYCYYINGNCYFNDKLSNKNIEVKSSYKNDKFIFGFKLFVYSMIIGFLKLIFSVKIPKIINIYHRIIIILVIIIIIYEILIQLNILNTKSFILNDLQYIK